MDKRRAKTDVSSKSAAKLQLFSHFSASIAQKFFSISVLVPFFNNY